MKRENGLDSKQHRERGRNMHYAQPQGDMENSRAYYGQPISKRPRSGQIARVENNEYENGDFDRTESASEESSESKAVATRNDSPSIDTTKPVK